MKRELLKLVTTDCAEVRDDMIEKLAKDFADIFDLEGCVDKAKIIFEKQLNDCSDDLLYTAAMQQSNLPMMLTDVFKKSIKKMNDNG